MPTLTFERGVLSWVADTSFEATPKPKYVATLRFLDGDGDIGLRESETDSPYHKAGDYYNNILVQLWLKKNGTYAEQKDLKVSYSGRIPFIEKRTQKPSLEGTIDYGIDLQALIEDTAQFKFQLIDRSLHRSNWVTSDEVPVVRLTDSESDEN